MATPTWPSASGTEGSGSQNSPVSSSGITVLVEPETPQIDIVFIHGFTGHPERTWTSRSKKREAAMTRSQSDIARPESPSKLRKLMRLGSSSGSSQTQNNTPGGAAYWPRDFVPATLPQARVLTYGYDTQIRHILAGPVSQNTLYDHAGDLLAALEAHRRREPSRRLILVAHSLGGLLVKEALRRSRGYNEGTPLRQVYESITGIVFFGTPHNGADPRSPTHHVVINLAKGMGFRVNENVAKALFPTAEYLKQLRDEFRRMLDKKGWLVHSFQELYALPGLWGKKVVEDDSACVSHLACEIVEHIGDTHTGMCQFQSLDGPEYRKVALALERIASHRQLEASNGSPEATDMKADIETTAQTFGSKLGGSLLLKSLEFPEMKSRVRFVENAHSKTCGWLLDRPEYTEWLAARFSDPRGFLWVKGKPGVGKSTIMKFLLSRVQKTLQGDKNIILHFFFNARGTELEKSIIGMYRSVLVQLLRAAPHTMVVLHSVDSLQDGRPQWTAPILRSLFRSAVEMLKGRTLICLIDALDECHEDEVRDMLSHFQDLGDMADSIQFHLRVCFSSRHYPHITVDRGASLVVEHLKGHDRDITSYIAAELRIGNSEYAPEIRAKIEHKGSGIFLWTVLVVRILNKEYDRGKISALQKRLEELPRGLSELFEDMLTRDHENTHVLLLCLQWVLFSKETLCCEELYFAIMSGIDVSEILHPWDRQVLKEWDMARYITNCSKGLVEILSGGGRVQFIHESVRDFLLQENGLTRLGPNLRDNFKATSQRRLMQCCVAQIHYAHEYLRDDSRGDSWSSSIIRTTGFPFLGYAIQNVLPHAEDAHKQGGLQFDEFVGNFDIGEWIFAKTLIETLRLVRNGDGFPHYSTKAHLLSVLSGENAISLASAHPELGKNHEIKSERYSDSPLFVALRIKHEAMARLLLSASRRNHLCPCGFTEDIGDRQVTLPAGSAEFEYNVALLQDSALAWDEEWLVFFHDMVYLGHYELAACRASSKYRAGRAYAAILVTHGYLPGHDELDRDEILARLFNRYGSDESNKPDTSGGLLGCLLKRCGIVLGGMIETGAISVDKIEPQKVVQTLAWLGGA